MAAESLNAFIYDGLRSPFGRNAGALATVRPDDLIAGVIRDLLARHGDALPQVEDVIIGCTNQAGEDSRNLARHAGLLAGLPVEAGGQTINRLCASGLAATITGCHAAHAGEGSLFVTGGCESMTRAPFVMSKAETAYSKQVKIFDSSLGARFPNPRFEAAFGDDTMTQTAENVAAELGIAREDADAYALRSQQRYERARAGGFYQDELTPVVIPGRRGKPDTVIDADEHPRPQTTAEALAKLKPLIPGGQVTAGSASGINDGAVALLVGNRQIGEQLGMAPKARLVASAVAGVPPRVMGLGPVPAITKALQRAGLTLKDMDVIEINEAFAAQVLGCLRQLGLADDDARVNPNGGAIAVGHPTGASGARLALTAIRQLHTTGGRYAVVSLCIGVGQGLAAVFERMG